MNSASVNMRVQLMVSHADCICFGYLPRSGIAGSKWEKVRSDVHLGAVSQPCGEDAFVECFSPESEDQVGSVVAVYLVQ